MNKQAHFIIALLAISSYFVLNYTINGETDLSDNWRFITCCVFGICAGICISLYCKPFLTNIFFHNNIVRAFSLIYCILTPFFESILTSSYNISIDNLYDKNEYVSVDEALDESDENIHAIFIFDNTQYFKTPDIPDKLKNPYRSYCNNIKKNYYIDFIQESNLTSYRKFFKAKLCATLLDLIDSPGKFSIYILENNIKECYLANDFKKQSIIDAIINLDNYPYKDNPKVESCYHSFYDKINSIIPENEIFHPDAFNKYVLYAYGDFMHDKNIEKNDFDNEANSIKKKQKQLAEKNIVQNLYVIPFDMENKSYTREFILDTATHRNIEYKNIIFADNYEPDIYEKNIHYHRVKYLKDMSVCWSKNNELCSPNLSFASSNNYIRLDKCSLKKGQYIFIKTKATKFQLTERFQKINSEQATIIFTGSFPTQESQIFLDIAKEGGIHGIVRLDFKRSHPSFYKWLLPVLSLLFGCLLGLNIPSIYSRIIT